MIILRDNGAPDSVDKKTDLHNIIITVIPKFLENELLRAKLASASTLPFTYSFLNDIIFHLY